MQNKLWKKGPVLGIIMLLVGTSVVQSTVWVEESTNGRSILYVGGNGPGNYSTIQEAIDDANSGDTVFVYNGSYYENVVIEKTINLIGEDRNNTIIDGNWGDYTIYITANLINISGFTIWRSSCSGINVVSNYNTITNNTILNNWCGGIDLNYSNSNTIIGNVISDATTGLYLSKSSNNVITGNDISLNDFGIEFGDSRNNIIDMNNISNNFVYGISLWYSSNNTISGNNITENNNDGIYLWFSSYNNIIYHNNFENNSINTYDECNNTWDNGYPFGGNYWSDYTGEDFYSGRNQDIPGSDGIGDTPYNITGGDNQDLYPLMYPFEMYYMLNISTPSEVNEGELFNVIVKSIGGTVIPNATVEFNDELKLTDSDGRVCFTAPQVGADTYYDIIATKTGYTGDTKTILVKDVPVEFVSVFMFGRITNLNVTGEYITFEAVNVRLIKFSPFQFLAFTSGEPITILKDYTGLLGALFGVQFIFATCDAPIG